MNSTSIIWRVFVVLWLWLDKTICNQLQYKHVTVIYYLHDWKFSEADQSSLTCLIRQSFGYMVQFWVRNYGNTQHYKDCNVVYVMLTAMTMIAKTDTYILIKMFFTLVLWTELCLMLMSWIGIITTTMIVLVMKTVLVMAMNTVIVTRIILIVARMVLISLLLTELMVIHD